MNGSAPLPASGTRQAATLPLTYGQQQLWFIDEFHHGLPAHNVPHQLGLIGALDLAALRRALDELVARHAALRTRMPADDTGSPTAVVDPPGPVRLELADYAGRSRDEAARQLAEFAAALALRPFQLAAGWPLRTALVRLSQREHALILVVHQLAFDEVSFAVLTRDLAALYEAEVAGRPPARPAAAPVTFAEVTLAERDRLQGETLAGLERFWKDTLAGFEASRFPTDRPRPVLASHDGAVEAITIEIAVLDGLRKLAAQEASTLATTLLAGIYALLYRYTGQSDLVVGTAAANRDRPELAGLIGFVEASLPIRTDASGDPSFTELLARATDATRSATEHQDLPFAKIVEAIGLERDTGRFPIFQTWLRCRTPIDEVTSGGVTFRPEPAPLPASRYDLGFDASPAENGLQVVATYPPALFDAGTVQRLLGHLAVLLRGAVANPVARLSELPMLTDAELHAELTEWNDTAREFAQISIIEGFEQQAQARPDAIAAEFEAEQISYRELDRQASHIASQLRDSGVGPEVLVGVCMTTSIARLAALLGIWKAGGGYVPLDPDLPAERLAYLISDTQLKVIVTDPASEPALPPAAALVLTLTGLAEHPGPSIASAGQPSDRAYVIYTSGSTGLPKGVEVEHRQAINFLQGMIEAWHITPASAVLSFAAYTFDVSVMDMFMPLLAGAKVVLAPAQTLHSPPRLANLIRSAKVTFACLPPAVLSLLTGEQFPDLHTLLSAGEELTSELLKSWLRDGLEIYNGYGPTECSIGATFMLLEPSTQLPPPIGKPKPNYLAYVLDEHLNPVPVGVTGELHIGGTGVARGYLNRPELTAQRFIDNPFRPGGRLYKTGDLVRRRPDGTLGFVGRIDDQVKINGLRVELGEIEAALLTHPQVSQAVVVVITDQAGKKQLAGYVRPEPGKPPQAGDLRSHLASTLPGYMVPSYLILLDELPLTTNMKINKAALPPPESIPAGAERVPPRTLIETVLVDLYGTILGNEQVGAADSFFDVGGNSLQALQLIAQLYSALAVDLDVSAVFLAPTAQQLAAVLRDKHGFDDADLDEESLDDLERQLPGQPAGAVSVADQA
jgi:amino acid adenylation domain-containing protein